MAATMSSSRKMDSMLIYTLVRASRIEPSVLHESLDKVKRELIQQIESIAPSRQGVGHRLVQEGLLEHPV